MGRKLRYDGSLGSPIANAFGTWDHAGQEKPYLPDQERRARALARSGGFTVIEDASPDPDPLDVLLGYAKENVDLAPEADTDEGGRWSPPRHSRTRRKRG